MMKLNRQQSLVCIFEFDSIAMTPEGDVEWWMFGYAKSAFTAAHLRVQLLLFKQESLTLACTSLRLQQIARRVSQHLFFWPDAIHTSREKRLLLF